MSDSTIRSSATRDTIAPPRLAYRIPAAAEQIGVSVSQMRHLISSGEIASFKTGPKAHHARFVRHEALVAYLDRLESAATNEVKVPSLQVVAEVDEHARELAAASA